MQNITREEDGQANDNPSLMAGCSLRGMPKHHPHIHSLSTTGPSGFAKLASLRSRHGRGTEEDPIEQKNRIKQKCSEHETHFRIKYNYRRNAPCLIDLRFQGRVRNLSASTFRAHVVPWVCMNLCGRTPGWFSTKSERDRGKDRERNRRTGAFSDDTTAVPVQPTCVHLLMQL